jgi:hypothetical protein
VTTELTTNEIRTYGGWRRTRGIGLFGLSETASIVVIAAVLVALGSATFNVAYILVTGPLSVLVILATITKRDGESLGAIALRRMRWSKGKLAGYQALRAGTVVEELGAWDLPGPLAPTRLLSVHDNVAGSYGIVWDQRSGFLSATLKCAALSTWLVDAQVGDGWVANWHAWLASLGYEPMIAWVSVTVDSAPEPGSTLAHHVYSRMTPDAPEHARRIMDELVRTSPGTAADIQTRVTITFDPAASSEPLDTLPDQAAEVSRLLAGMESALRACGVGAVERAQDYELAGVVRTAFDPEARGEVQSLVGAAATGSRAAAESLTWHEAGPTGHEEHWRHYQHDSGTSVVWGWHEAPRQRVTSSVLARLMSPGRFPRRVTLLYRPYSSAVAAHQLEEQVNAAAFREAVRKAQGRDETARDRTDREQAVAAAREEATGAGLVRVSLYVCVTVIDPDDLPTAIAEVEARAGQSKIKLRRLAGSQLSGFCATLPAGLHPANLARRGHR